MDAAQRCVSIPDQVSTNCRISLNCRCRFFDGGTIDLERTGYAQSLAWQAVQSLITSGVTFGAFAYGYGLIILTAARCLAGTSRQFQIECVGDGGQARDGL